MTTPNRTVALVVTFEKGTTDRDVKELQKDLDGVGDSAARVGKTTGTAFKTASQAIKDTVSEAGKLRKELSTTATLNFDPAAARKAIRETKLEIGELKAALAAVDDNGNKVLTGGDREAARNSLEKLKATLLQLRADSDRFAESSQSALRGLRKEASSPISLQLDPAAARRAIRETQREIAVLRAQLAAVDDQGNRLLSGDQRESARNNLLKLLAVLADLKTKTVEVGDSSQRSGEQAVNVLDAVTDTSSKATTAIALLAVALGGALYALTLFVQKGVEFNKKLEDNRVAVGALIASFDDVEGRDPLQKLRRGLSLAQDQTKALRLDALKTSATFESLAEGFQQALGPGLESGLNLNQIRLLTLQIGQAAKAQGLADDKIAQEIRAILSGDITSDATVAKALGITSADINKLQGNADALFDYLQGKLKTFSAAGELASQTLSGLLSNFGEATTTAAAKATEGIYDRLKAGVVSLLPGLFDVATGEVNRNLKPILDLFDRFGSVLVDRIAEAARIVIGQFELFGRTLDANRDIVDLIVASFDEFLQAFIEFGSEFRELLAPGSGREFLQTVRKTTESVVTLAKVIFTLANFVVAFAKATQTIAGYIFAIPIALLERAAELTGIISDHSKEIQGRAFTDVEIAAARMLDDVTASTRANVDSVRETAQTAVEEINRLRKLGKDVGALPEILETVKKFEEEARKAQAVIEILNDRRRKGEIINQAQAEAAENSAFRAATAAVRAKNLLKAEIDRLTGPKTILGKDEKEQLENLEKSIGNLKRETESLRSGGGKLFDLQVEESGLRELKKRLEDILKLRRELNVSVSDALPETQAAQEAEIRALGREKSYREGLIKLSEEQLDAANKLRLASAAATAPIIDAQLRADTDYLEGVRKKREAEAQLTADIVNEIRRRRDAERDANSEAENAQAEAFKALLDRAAAARRAALQSRAELGFANGDYGSANRIIAGAVEAARAPAAATVASPVVAKLAETNNLVGSILTTIKTAETKAAASPSSSSRFSSGINVSPQLRAFLDTIAYAEGTDKTGSGGGYNVKVGGGRIADLSRKDRSIVQLSPTLRSSAAGRYQFLNKTWGELAATLQLPDFGPLSQDKAAVELIRRAGALPDIEAGNFEVAARKVRKIWASFPGAGYGQRELKLTRLRSVFNSRLGAGVPTPGSIDGGTDFVEVNGGDTLIPNTPQVLATDFSGGRAVFGDNSVNAGTDFVQVNAGLRDDFIPPTPSTIAADLSGRTQLTFPGGDTEEDIRQQIRRDEADAKLNATKLQTKEIEQDIAELRAGKGTAAVQAIADAELRRKTQTADSLRNLQAAEEELARFRSGDAETIENARRDAATSRIQAQTATARRIIELEDQIANASEGAADRIKVAQLEAIRARQTAEEEAAASIIRSQQELADKTVFSQTQYTAGILDYLNRSSKSITQIAIDARTGTLDALFKGVDDGLSKITAKLGIFGGVIKQVLGDLIRLFANRFLAQLFGGGGVGASGGVGGTPGFAGGAGAGASGGGGGILGNIFGGGGGILGGILGLFTGRKSAAAGGGASLGGKVLNDILGLKGGGEKNDGTTVTESAGQARSGFGGILGDIVGKTLGGASKSGGAAGIPGQLSLSGLKGSIGGIAPLLGLSLGGQIGGPLGAIGGALLGGSLFAGLGGLSGTIAAGGTLGGLAGGAAAFLTNPFTIAIGAALLIGGFFLSRAKQRKADEKMRDKILGDTLTAINDLIKDVDKNRVDGSSAVTQGKQIREQYLQQINSLKTGSVRNSAIKNQLPQVDSALDRLRQASDRQADRRERDARLVPEFATGGDVQKSFSGRVPGVYRGAGFDDTVIAVQGDETVLTPEQRKKLRLTPKKLAAAGVPGYATGGAVGGGGPDVSGPSGDIRISVGTVTLQVSPSDATKLVVTGAKSSTGARVIFETQTEFRKAGEQ